MKDDFIYKALPNVPKRFAESLYKKIATNASTRNESKKSSKPRMLQWSYIFVLILGMAFLVAWSQIRLRIRYVPIGDLWLVEYAKETQNAPDESFPNVFVPTPKPPPTVIVDGMVYEFWPLKTLSPDWIPDGFDEIGIPASMISYEETIGLWSNDAGDKIRLYAVPQAGGMHPYAPPEMWKEVRVNGEQAILVYGRLALANPQNPTEQRKWDETLGVQLHWIMEESVYALETFGPYLSEQDLIRMAESMKVDPPHWSP